MYGTPTAAAAPPAPARTGAVTGDRCDTVYTRSRLDLHVVRVLSAKSRSLQNRGPYIHYYVDEDHDLAIHNVPISMMRLHILMHIVWDWEDRYLARTAILRLGGFVSKSWSDATVKTTVLAKSWSSSILGIYMIAVARSYKIGIRMDT